LDELKLTSKKFCDRVTYSRPRDAAPQPRPRVNTKNIPTTTRRASFPDQSGYFATRISRRNKIRLKNIDPLNGFAPSRPFPFSIPGNHSENARAAVTASQRYNGG
jgi:hypothetical protein